MFRVEILSRRDLQDIEPQRSFVEAEGSRGGLLGALDCRRLLV